MHARLSNLLDDLNKLTVVECQSLTREEANVLYLALAVAQVCVDASRCMNGDLDWPNAMTRQYMTREQT